MNEQEIELLKAALEELGFRREDYANPHAPIATKQFEDGELEIFAHFHPNDGRESSDG